MHKFIPMPQTMKIPDAKAAVDKEWEKLEKIANMADDQSEEQKRCHQRGTEEQRTVHFATLMDMCHLKNVELEHKFQKYKGQFVLRGDTVKDDSDSHAVFTEQGFVCITIDGRKSNG